MSADDRAEPDIPATPRLNFPRATEGSAVPTEHKDVHIMETDPKLDDLTVAELQRRQEEIDRKIREKKEAEKRAIIAQIVDVVIGHHIPIDELVDALGGLKIKRKGMKAVQKYRDPATGVTWSGRGKEPTWIRGKDRRKFEIPDEE